MAGAAGCVRARGRAGRRSGRAQSSPGRAAGSGQKMTGQLSQHGPASVSSAARRLSQPVAQEAEAHQPGPATRALHTCSPHPATPRAPCPARGFFKWPSQAISLAQDAERTFPCLERPPSPEHACSPAPPTGARAHPGWLQALSVHRETPNLRLRVSGSHCTCRPLSTTGTVPSAQ